jgi:NAD-dependent deacetylase
MNIFILTGAGISAESGLGTFRDEEGLWTRFDLAEVATPQGFARDPAKVHAFYDVRRRSLLEAHPNAAHFALAYLEDEMTTRGGSLFLCTQNIDNLHERAGSKQVVHMHGKLLEARCLNCEAVLEWREDMAGSSVCTCCLRARTLRPNVVWFGETPMHMELIEEALYKADLFVSIGTSGSIYPAAGFVSDAQNAGIRTCEINLEPSGSNREFDEAYYELATKAVPHWVNAVLSDRHNALVVNRS